jgi:hypothetical protein
MRKVLIFAGFAGLIAIPAIASAECNPRCVAKCEATAESAHMTIPACIEEWSKINENPRRAHQLDVQYWKTHPEMAKYNRWGVK